MLTPKPLAGPKPSYGLWILDCFQKCTKPRSRPATSLAGPDPIFKVARQTIPRSRDGIAEKHVFDSPTPVAETSWSGRYELFDEAAHHG
jgi:hypothetical protein